MLLSIELSGPALLTEASSSLMTTLIKLRIAENPAHFNQTAERVLNWFLSKWTPSKCTLDYSLLFNANESQVSGQNEPTHLSTATTAMPATCYDCFMPVLIAHMCRWILHHS